MGKKPSRASTMGMREYESTSALNTPSPHTATTDDGEGQLHGWIVALAFVLLATLVYRATARRRAELG